MARITIEDCLQNISNRFELVLVASKRAKQLSREAITPLVPWEEDKVTVVALREIANNLIGKEILDENTDSSRYSLVDLENISKEIIDETQNIVEDKGEDTVMESLE